MPIQPKTSISDFANADNIIPESHNAMEYIGKPLILLGFEERNSAPTPSNPNPGTFFVMSCCEPDSEEEIIITCGGYVVREQLHAITNKVEQLPCAITFRKRPDGKTWYLA